MSSYICYNDVNVVGVTFDNDDGSNRQKILAKTKCDEALFIDLVIVNNCVGVTLKHY